MDLDTIGLICGLGQKTMLCIKKGLKSIQYDKKQKSDKMIHQIISDINMMLNIIQTYMKIDKESTTELKQL